jgi:Tetratricopeptide repeat
LNRHFTLWLGLFGLATTLTGCDYAPSRPPIHPSEIASGPLPGDPGHTTDKSSPTSGPGGDPLGISQEDLDKQKIILENFLNLIDKASTKPGGSNFAIATDNLNELFMIATRPGDFTYAPRARDFLMSLIFDLSNQKQDPEPVVKAFCSEKFTIKDARHIEDCMLYRSIANRVAGDQGDDLAKVRRIFDWTVRNVVLVPPESLSGNGMRQAQVRPADALFRGMATENGGRWSERGWVFMALCRQIGVDVGLLTYTTKPSVLATPAAAAARPASIWICAAVIDGKAYLFDQRIGLEIPSPDGNGVATLEEAITDPNVLARLDLPGISRYVGPTASELAGSSSKIGVLLDSSQGYFAPRMRQLQGMLTAKHRTVLFRDALEQARGFAKAMGPRLGTIALWDLPVFVENSLFTDGVFVASTQMSLQFFDDKLPLLYARTSQLRGDLSEAIGKYVALRLRNDAVMNDAKKTPIPPEVQRALDFYSTNYLAQCQLDQGKVAQAEDLYRKLVELSPDPGPGRYFYYMLRWNALMNLGRICENKGDRAGAIACYSQDCQTFQRHGNLLRARNLVWNHPFEDPVSPLPSAPPEPTPTPAPTPAPAPEVKSASK